MDGLIINTVQQVVERFKGKKDLQISESAKKVVSYRLGLVDFAVGLVNFFLKVTQITEIIILR